MIPPAPAKIGTRAYNVFLNSRSPIEARNNLADNDADRLRSSPPCRHVQTLLPRSNLVSQEGGGAS